MRPMFDIDYDALARDLLSALDTAVKRRVSRHMSDYTARRLKARVHDIASVLLGDAGYRGVSRDTYLASLDVESIGRGEVRIQLLGSFPRAMEYGWAPPNSSRWEDGIGKYDGAEHDMRPMLLAGGKTHRVMKLTTRATFTSLRERVIKAAVAAMRDFPVRSVPGLQDTHRVGSPAWYIGSRRGRNGKEIDTAIAHAETISRKRANQIGAEATKYPWRLGPSMTQQRAQKIAHSIVSTLRAQKTIGEDTPVHRDAGQWAGAVGYNTQDMEAFKQATAKDPAKGLNVYGLPRRAKHSTSIFARMTRTGTRAVGKRKNVGIYTVFRTISRNAGIDKWWSKGFKPVGLFKSDEFHEDVLKEAARLILGEER